MMAIVTISRGSYSRGKEVAEKVAKRLGYSCISRDTIIDGCHVFDIPEVKLIRAIENAPSILERFTGGKMRFLACFQAILLEHFQEDDVVYHGLAGHFFVKNVSHVLKVRILAEMEDRVKLEMEREGISRSEALRILKNDDEERRKWSLHTFGIDTWNPALYDLVLNIKKITADNAADLICQTVALERFQTTAESQRAMDNLTVAARVKAVLLPIKEDAEVFADDGVVRIEVRSLQLQEERRIRDLAESVPGVTEVEIKAQESKRAP